MRCEEVMRKDVERVLPMAPASEAARRMRERNVGFLPVCDESGKVLGTVTDRDLALRVLGERRDPDVPVRDIMTPGVVACRPHDDLADAERRMAELRKSRIVCVDAAGRLVGVISLSDLVQRDEPAAAVRTMRWVTSRKTDRAAP